MILKRRSASRRARSATSSPSVATDVCGFRCDPPSAFFWRGKTPRAFEDATHRAIRVSLGLAREGVQLSELLKTAAHSLAMSAASAGHADGLPAPPVFEWERGLTCGEQIALRRRLAGGAAVGCCDEQRPGRGPADGLSEAMAYTWMGCGDRTSGTHGGCDGQ